MDMTQLQNEIDLYFSNRKRPLVIASWGMSLDGKTVTHQLDSRQISAMESQRHCHQLRHQIDAILVGANTAIKDDPLLTVRNIDLTHKQPIRIILSSSGILPFNLKMFQCQMPAKTIIATTAEVSLNYGDHVEMLHIKKNDQEQVNLQSLLFELGKRGIKSLLVEGGMTVLQSFFNEQLVDKINVYLSPVIIGTLPKKHVLKNMTLSALGNDCLFSADYN